MMLCTDEREICFTCYLSDLTMAVCVLFLTVHGQTRRFATFMSATTTCKAFNTTKFGDSLHSASDLNHRETISCSEIL